MLPMNGLNRALKMLIVKCTTIAWFSTNQLGGKTWKHCTEQNSRHRRFYHNCRQQLAKHHVQYALTL
jgi:hypothetical protein